MLDKTTTVNLLYDFYRPLLNGKQQTFMELYYGEDWSLSEIAEHFSISRQAVHDLIKRVEKTLHHFEQELHLVEKFERRKELVRNVKLELAGEPQLAERIYPLLDQLLEID